MLLSAELKRRMYDVVHRNGTCYLSEIPGLYQAQCGKRLEYENLGFSSLMALVQACKPYLQTTFNTEKAQELVRAGARPPPVHGEEEPDPQDQANEDEVKQWIFAGQHFQALDLLMNLPEITCTKCNCLTGRFQICQRCKHVLCYPCNKDMGQPPRCQRCSNLAPGLSTELTMNLSILPEHLMDAVLELACVCPFGHGIAQKMTLRKFLSHFWRCPYNSQLTKGLVVDRPVAKGSQDDDDEDANSSCSGDSLSSTIRDNFEHVSERLRVWIEKELERDHEILATVQLPTSHSALNDTAEDNARRSIKQVSADDTNRPSVPISKTHTSRGGPEGRLRHEKKYYCAPTVEVVNRTKNWRREEEDRSQENHFDSSASNLEASDVLPVTRDSRGGGYSAPRLSSRRSEATFGSELAESERRLRASGELAQLFVYNFVDPDDIDTRLLPADHKFANPFQWMLSASPGDQLILLESPHNTINHWALCRNEAGTMGWVPTKAFRKPLESAAEFSRRLSRLVCR